VVARSGVALGGILGAYCPNANKRRGHPE
jgi:hypothetical protein